MNRKKVAANAPRGTWRGTRRKSEFAARKPVGGFCFVPAMAILSLWWAYRQAIVGILEVRVWLAVFEAVARRCGARDKCRRRFVEHELAHLVGVSEERIRCSLRRLGRAGFLRWSETAIRFGYGTDGLSDEERTGLQAFVEGVQNHRRKVPLPRTVLKLLCRATRPVLVATVLGHALRCLYYRNGACCPDGRCKASWVADVFDVDARNVKAARTELVRSGVLIRDASNQGSMNRWGPRVRFNLSWRPNGQPARQSPPLGAQKPAESPPPKKNRELVSRSENQKPAARGPTGACASKSGKCRPKPELVTPRDLADPERIAQFYTQAVRQSLIRHSESERLNVFAAAAHAMTYGTTNPCGLFVWLVKQRRWSYLTLQDEDDARHAIRSLDQRASASHFRTSASLPTQNGFGLRRRAERFAGGRSAIARRYQSDRLPDADPSGSILQAAKRRRQRQRHANDRILHDLPYAVRRHRVLAPCRPAGPWDPMVTDAHALVAGAGPEPEGSSSWKALRISGTMSTRLAVPSQGERLVMIWFTADTHFGHANIIQHCRRPFASVEEMDQTLIANINARVKPGDTLYHLGDFAFRGAKPAFYRDQIRCRRLILILGNHDPQSAAGYPKPDFAAHFSEVHPLLRIKVAVNGSAQIIILCHYAMRAWDRAHYGAWHLFGHSHGSLPDDPYARSWDVGVDRNAFQPLSLDEIATIMKRKQFQPIDHHRPESPSEL